MNKTLIYILLATLTAIMLTACTEGNEPAPTQEVEATFRIVSRATTVGPEDPSGDNERINDWWIVFATMDGTIMRIVDRPTGLGAVEHESVKAKIPAGQYRVYAFANLTKQQVKDATDLEFVEKGTLPDNIDAAVWKNLNPDLPAGSLIPMTGYQTVTVTGAANQNFAIEVVRLYAKLEFEFSSRANAADLQVVGLVMNPLYEGDLKLWPNYKNLGSRPYTRPVADAVYCNHTFATPIQVPGSSEGLQNVPAHLYITESESDIHPTHHYHIGFDILRQYPTGPAREVIHAIINDLDYINRNDHLKLPITFTDWILDFQVLFYPPIGGYPAVLIDSKDSEYYAIFGTQGRFIINARVRPADKFEYIAQDTYDLSILSIEGDTNIFEVPPAFESTGELIGELASTTGEARVNIKLSVQRTTTPSGTITHEYYRTLYIIRKNK